MLALQWLAGRHWTRVAAALALVVIAATPGVWASGLGARLPEAIGPYLDVRTGSRFPLFPFSAFVLAGTLAGATLGRAEPRTRHRRALVAGAALLAAGGVLAWLLAGRVEYWGPSPAYSLVRLGGLVLLMRLVEIAAAARLPGIARAGPARATRRCSSTCCTSTCSSAASSATRRSPACRADSAPLAAAVVVVAMVPVLLVGSLGVAGREAPRRRTRRASRSCS